jgi:hypothetical protein
LCGESDPGEDQQRAEVLHYGAGDQVTPFIDEGRVESGRKLLQTE